MKWRIIRFFQDQRFLIYKSGGNEFIICKGSDWNDQVWEFSLDEFDELRFVIDDDGEIQISWEEASG